MIRKSLKNKILLFLMINIVIAIMLSISVAFASAQPLQIGENEKGLSIDSYHVREYGADFYTSEKLLQERPYSVEAWVYLPSSLEGNAPGVIVSNRSMIKGYFSFSIIAGNKPQFEWWDTKISSNLKRTYAFDGNSVVPYDVWTHVAIVHDKENDEISCFINGIKTGTHTEVQDTTINMYKYPLCLGGDLTSENKSYFKGSLQDVTLFSDTRTAEEVLSDYNNGVDVNDENLIAHFDIDANDMCKDIADESGNGYDLTYSPAWVEEDYMETWRQESFDRAYSFAVIGDTQYAINSWPDTADKMYQWIVDNKEEKNIKYVLGLGDITDDNTVTQWDRAKQAISKMNGELEYFLIRGNHDATNDLFDLYFANEPYYAPQFEEYGGVFQEDSLKNVYRTMRIGSTDWLFLCLDYHVNAEIFAWANEVLATYPDHKAVILTHNYIGHDGMLCDKVGEADVWLEYSGDSYWHKLAKYHANVNMVICGHRSYDRIVCTQVKGIHGNTVTQLLIDPQDMDRFHEGVGMVAMFYFNEDGSKLEIEYYSTIREQYYRTSNQMRIDLFAESETLTENWDCNSAVKPYGKGTKEDPYLISGGEHLFWMSQQVGTGEIPNVFSNPFEDKYFIQTNDIDMSGGTFKSIGYYFDSEEKGCVFGGNYDGQGFVIKNCKVFSPYVNGKDALFGNIYGATIKNVVLENVTSSNGDALVVGELNESNNESEYNTIENCINSDGSIVNTLHIWGDGQITKPATHLEEGEIKYVCSHCGIDKVEIIPKLTAHEFSKWVKGENGCVSNCICGKTRSHNHSYKDIEIIKSPTHKEKGLSSYTCEYCGETHTEEVATIGEHEFKNGVAHGDKHKLECECGETKVEKHVWDDGEITKKPTKTKTGVKTYSCLYCNLTKTEEIPIDENAKDDSCSGKINASNFVCILVLPIAFYSFIRKGKHLQKFKKRRQ